MRFIVVYGTEDNVGTFWYMDQAGDPRQSLEQIQITFWLSIIDQEGETRPGKDFLWNCAGIQNWRHLEHGL